MHDTGCLGLVHWDDPEGGYGEGGGRGVHDGERRCACGGFISMFGKASTILWSLKKKKKTNNHLPQAILVFLRLELGGLQVRHL